MSSNLSLDKPPEPTASVKPPRRLGDVVFANTARTASFMIMVALAGVFIFLAIEGIPGMSAPGDNFEPNHSSFWPYAGALVLGTILAAIIALVLAVPFAIGIALFVSHYAPRRLAAPIAYVMDLLAAVPSVVYGLWGARVLSNELKPVHVWLNDNLGWFPLFSGEASTTGKTMFTAGVVLAVMILPIISAISREVFAQTPKLHEEAALALGATRWEMIRMAVLPYARSGMVSAVMLGLGRALGETMAVAMIMSASPLNTLRIITNSSPATIASNIAANYKEGSPDKQAVLIATGLILFALTFAVNAAARGVVARNERKQRG